MPSPLCPQYTYLASAPMCYKRVNAGTCNALHNIYIAVTACGNHTHGAGRLQLPQGLLSGQHHHCRRRRHHSSRGSDSRPCAHLSCASSQYSRSGSSGLGHHMRPPVPCVFIVTPPQGVQLNQPNIPRRNLPRKAYAATAAATAATASATTSAATGASLWQAVCRCLCTAVAAAVVAAAAAAAALQQKLLLQFLQAGQGQQRPLGVRLNFQQLLARLLVARASPWACRRGMW